MMFHTTAFILGFLPVCLTGFFLLGRFFMVKWTLCWLVACSLFFYAWWNPEHLPLLLGSVGLNYAIARVLSQTIRPRTWLTAGIVLNLAILGWFKYADFLLHIVAPQAPPLHITLPLAISFFTFQQIMFLVDANRDRVRHAQVPGRTQRGSYVMVGEGPPSTPSNAGPGKGMDDRPSSVGAKMAGTRPAMTEKGRPATTERAYLAAAVRACGTLMSRPTASAGAAVPCPPARRSGGRRSVCG